MMDSPRTLGEDAAMPEHDDLDRAADGDPAVALPALRRLRDWFAEREGAAVRNARAQGWTWERIGKALDRKRQTVWHRYRDE
jgi:hypothetical protein